MITSILLIEVQSLINHFLQTFFIISENIYFFANPNPAKLINKTSLFMTVKSLAKLEFLLKKLSATS